MIIISPKISIIVPVYKVEQYLARCIDSILAQTFTDFELILVDDGSPDGCPAICDKYAAKDKRIRVIHKENGGVSSARNTGLNAATGEYIMFCDSDDTVDPAWCNKLYDAVVRFPTAWINCNVYAVAADGQLQIRKPVQEPYPQFQRLTFSELYTATLCGSPCNKIYCRETIETNNLRFNLNYKIGEDTSFNMQYYQYCNDIVFLPAPLYYYWQNSDSAIHSYNYNSFDLYRHSFFDCLPFIEERFMDEYLDSWLWRFVSMLEDAFATQSPLRFFQKFQYCHKMMQTKEFRYCADAAPGKRESALFMKVIRKHNYYLLWTFQRLCKLKAHLCR